MKTQRTYTSIFRELALAEDKDDYLKSTFADPINTLNRLWFFRTQAPFSAVNYIFGGAFLEKRGNREKAKSALVWLSARVQLINRLTSQSLIKSDYIKKSDIMDQSKELRKALVDMIAAEKDRIAAYGDRDALNKAIANLEVITRNAENTLEKTR